MCPGLNILETGVLWRIFWDTVTRVIFQKKCVYELLTRAVSDYLGSLGEEEKPTVAGSEMSTK